jgi:hypothetical protein
MINHPANLFIISLPDGMIQGFHPPSPTPGFIKTHIHRNPVKPGGKPRFRTVFFRSPVNPQKDFLGQVFRQGLVPAKPVTEIDYGFPVCFKQLPECLLAAFLKLEHTPDIRIGCRIFFTEHSQGDQRLLSINR